MNYTARVFVEKLGLDSHQSRHVIKCVFHSDTRGASLSIDLEKGAFYCHGACSEPKGGYAIEFLIKWARYKEGRTLTREEAKRYVNRIFRTLSGAERAKQHTQDDVIACCHASRARAIELAHNCKAYAQFLTADVMVRGHEQLPNDDDAIWDELEVVHKKATFAEYVWSTTEGIKSPPTPAMLRLYAALQRLGLWTMADRDVYETQRVLRSRERALLRDQDVRKGESCRPKRTAVRNDPESLRPLRTPLT